MPVSISLTEFLEEFPQFNDNKAFRCSRCKAVLDYVPSMGAIICFKCKTESRRSLPQEFQEWVKSNSQRILELQRLDYQKESMR